MRSRQFRFCILFAVAVLASAGIVTTEALAQEIVRVYGSEGPAPAVHEAAITFEGTANVKVEVVSGPVTKWLDSAKADADVIFCSAEFMMSDLIQAGELQIDPASVTPLHLRPSAILVRRGNPKGIEDFPDLLQAGVRVMVVTGSSIRTFKTSMEGCMNFDCILKAITF